MRLAGRQTQKFVSMLLPTPEIQGSFGQHCSFQCFRQGGQSSPYTTDSSSRVNALRGNSQ
jgi:hypothetical protein